jgi:hypothetical protein
MKFPFAVLVLLILLVLTVPGIGFDPGNNFVSKEVVVPAINNNEVDSVSHTSFYYARRVGTVGRDKSGRNFPIYEIVGINDNGSEDVVGKVGKDGSYVRNIYYAPYGDVVVIDSEREVEIMDLRTGEVRVVHVEGVQTELIREGHSPETCISQVSGVAVNADASTLLVGRSDGFFCRFHQTLLVYDLTNEEYQLREQFEIDRTNYRATNVPTDWVRGGIYGNYLMGVIPGYKGPGNRSSFVFDFRNREFIEPYSDLLVRSTSSFVYDLKNNRALFVARHDKAFACGEEPGIASGDFIYSFDLDSLSNKAIFKGDGNSISYVGYVNPLLVGDGRYLIARKIKYEFDEKYDCLTGDYDGAEFVAIDILNGEEEIIDDVVLWSREHNSTFHIVMPGSLGYSGYRLVSSGQIVDEGRELIFLGFKE